MPAVPARISKISFHQDFYWICLLQVYVGCLWTYGLNVHIGCACLWFHSLLVEAGKACGRCCGWYNARAGVHTSCFMAATLWSHVYHVLLRKMFTWCGHNYQIFHILYILHRTMDRLTASDSGHDHIRWHFHLSLFILADFAFKEILRRSWLQYPVQYNTMQ